MKTLTQKQVNESIINFPESQRKGKEWVFGKKTYKTPFNPIKRSMTRSNKVMKESFDNSSVR